MDATQFDCICRQHQGITLESKERRPRIGDGRQAEEITEQPVSAFAPLVHYQADGPALPELFYEHEALTFRRQDGDTRAGAHLSYDGFEPGILAYDGHVAELGAKQPRGIGENLPVPDVAREHHEPPSACQRLIQIFFPLHYDPGLDLLITHVYILYRIHHDLPLVHKHLQSKTPRVIQPEGGAHLDLHDLSPQRHEDPDEEHDGPAEGYGSMVRHGTDKPDHGECPIVLYIAV